EATPLQLCHSLASWVCWGPTSNKYRSRRGNVTMGEIVQMKSAILIRDTLPEDAKAVSVLIDSVSRERRYLAGTSGFSEEATASFIASVKAAKGVHLIAIVDDAV